MLFRIKQWAKMLLQNVFLPLIYRYYSRKPVQKGKILMADAHHEELPFSMRHMYDTLIKQGETPKLFLADFGRIGFGKMITFLFCFMKEYASADYVFICDYFLPASSCRKRKETTLVQLWHSCGLMKKIAFDAGEDIPKGYKGDLFGNYSLLTMSAEVCVPVHAYALRIPEDRIRATGISRTDVYFDPKWNENCRERFFRNYPEAAGRKIVVWAPTFRGNAGKPYLEGLEAVRQAAVLLGEEWYLIIKAHPHIDAREKVSNCSIPTEELFAAADLLITDYSSVLFDYLIYNKPLLLFAPDLKYYEEARGFYIEYRNMPFPIVERGEELAEAIRSSMHPSEIDLVKREEFCRSYTGSCDGHATERILELIGLNEKENR